MRPIEKHRSVESTLEGEKIAMSVRPEDWHHLMGVLTDMYPDPELASVREYATNARDSHIEAGVSRPIEVETPTDLRRTLVIRDFGVGLDAESIRRIYSQYGASTKRGSNAATGMFGIGCKAALSYTDQFTVVGTKDGIRTTVTISRTEKGGGECLVVDESETDAPNGVEVQIPADRHNDMEQKACEFFRWWEAGTVLLNGEEPPAAPGLYLGDGVWVASQDDVEENLVVMGGVPYPAGSFGDSDLRLYARAIVVRIPVGAAEPTPPREALLDGDTTKAALADAGARFRRQAKVRAEAALEEAKTPGQALRAWHEYTSLVPRKFLPQIKWRGRDVPENLDCRVGTVPRHISSYQPGNTCSWSRQVQTIAAANALWVTGWDNSQWSKSQRDKLLRYLDVKHPGLDHDTILITEGDVPDVDWIEGAAEVRWSDIRKWRDPDAAKVTTGNGAVAGTYYVYGADSYKTPIADIKAHTGPVYYHEGRSGSGGTVARLIQEVEKDAWVVEVATTRVAKFKRLLPKVPAANAQLVRLAKQKIGAIPSDELEAWRFDIDSLYQYREVIPELDPDDLDDPELADLVRLWARREPARNKYQDHQVWLQYLPPDSAPKATKPPIGKGELERRYPLLSLLRPSYGRSLRGKVAEDVTFYLNAAYAERKEQ